MIEYFVFAIETLILCIYVFYLVNQYSAKDVPRYVKILTFLSWFFTFICFIILPIDIANSYRDSQVQTYQQTSDFLFVFWRILYWISFILSWILLPLFQDYEDSGEFTTKRKLFSSIKKNLIIYASGLIMGISLIFYLSMSQKLSFEAIEGILVGLGNAFGILLVILLLGYGFVAIPKKYIKESDQNKMLSTYYGKAIEIDEKRTENLYDMEEKSRALLILQKKYANSEFLQFLILIADLIPNEFRVTHTSGSSDVIIQEYEPLTIDKVAYLNRDVKRLVSDLHRIEIRFSVISVQVQKLERVTGLYDNVQLKIEGGVQSKFGKINMALNNLWDYKVRRPFNKYLGYLFALMSIIMLFCELSIFTGVPVNLIHTFVDLDLGYYSTQFILIPFVSYISFCTYYGLFHMNIAGLFSFNKHHQTDATSLLFGSINFGRVAFPLCYNFIQLTQVQVPTQFSKILGVMNLVPIFGQVFPVALPVMLIIMCLINLFNFQGRVMNSIGLGNYAEMNHKDGITEEGRRIIQKLNDQKSKQRSQENKSISSQVELVKQKAPQNRNNFNNQYSENFNNILNI